MSEIKVMPPDSARAGLPAPTERQISFATKLLEIPGQFDVEILAGVLATEAAHARHEEQKSWHKERQELEKKLRDSEAAYKALAAHHNQHCTCMEIY